MPEHNSEQSFILSDFEWQNILTELDQEIEVVRNYVDLKQRLTELTIEMMNYYRTHIVLLSRYEHLPFDLDVPAAVIAEILDREQANTPFESLTAKLDVYHDIILQNGGPMHASAVAAAAIQRGVRWQGVNPPAIKVRNAMTRSARFENVGRNTWEITDRKEVKAEEEND